MRSKPSQANASTRAAKRDRLVLIGVLGFVAVVNLLTMPGTYYLGDNFTPRAEAINLVQTGHLGIDYSLVDVRRIMGGDRGQFFFEHDDKQRYFSKYGIGNTILYVVPVLAERIFAGPLEPFHDSKSLLFLLGALQVVFSLLSAMLLFRIASLFTNEDWIRIIFTIGNAHMTFMWNYLRAPALEGFQLCAFLAFAYSCLKFAMGFRADGTGQWRRLLWASLSLGALILLKTYFCLLIPVHGAFAVWAALPRTCVPLWRRLVATLMEYRWRYVVHVAAPLLVTLGLTMFVSYVKFGSVLDLGYGQWKGPDQVQPHDRFSIEFFPRALADFTISWRYGIFWHSPLLAFSVIGIVRFARKFPMELGFIASLFLAIFLSICTFSAYSGEWCYGPRYLLCAVAIMSVPFVETLRFLAENKRKAWSLALGVAMAGALLVSLRTQVRVNSLSFFTKHQVLGLFRQASDPEIDRYFETSSFSRVNADLIAFRDAGQPFYPLTILKARYDSPGMPVSELVQQILRGMLTPNYFFFSSPQP